MQMYIFAIVHVEGIIMKASKRSKKAIEYIIYIFVIALLVTGIYWYGMNKNSKDGLKAALDKHEVLIDYFIEEPLAYALVSKAGNAEYGDFFVGFDRNQRGFTRIYENDFKQLKPWKIEVADIDGDNNNEILIAVKKATYFDKEVKNRMFIFNYQDNILVKKWTGSQIAGRWREFYVGDFLPIPGEELIFIQQQDDGKERISIYSWFDFGFFMIANSDGYHKIEEINIIDENNLEVTYYILGNGKKRHEESHCLEAIDGRLLIKKD